MKKDLLTLLDLDAESLHAILQQARSFKKERKKQKTSDILKGKNVALIFEKPSTRTKVSFDIAVNELGGHSIYLDASSSQLGRGETYYDTGQVLSRYVHGIVMRTSAQKNLEELARGASVPVINALSDLSHPCQIISDLFTIQEVNKDLSKLKISYIGDGNNIANSWITAAILVGFELNIATPEGYEPSASILKEIGRERHSHIHIGNDPVVAVKEADVINTDTWFSMGQKILDEKNRVFQSFQVNAKLLSHAKKGAIVLHCLPAHREEEITSEVMDGPQSRIWDQAENRLHVQKAILEILLKR
ncbi:MAG: ornithine carbamoyltransferase [Deltaproteobacteria bacterium]|nr:ornithine carbamoyltransferase [Deltaproteobacteria bacterium]